MIRSILLFLFLIGCFQLNAQGKLLLVGGGTEKNGQSSWSTPAYRWAAEGKKVAIVGTSTGSLAPYFMNQCGAARAKEFAINTADSADSQATYDTLVSYDMIFFRGGDQFEYYDLYKNTKLQDAVNYVFDQGRVIGGTSAGMHILSSVVFTAENGTVYPYESIENPNNQYMTLEDDFFNFVPGFIFDTHFSERGRFGRLVGFLANYQLNEGLNIAGLGMDDMTCMTVDENGLGTVYGTGCANIYQAGSTYSLNGTKLLADTVNVTQLLQGCTYDFTTGTATYSGLDLPINTSLLEETGNYTILASGSDNLSQNQDMLNDLVNDCGVASAGILILSGDLILANSYGDKLADLGASQVYIFTPSIASGNDEILASQISSTSKILFLKNSLSDFLPFLGSANGKLLQQELRTDGMISAFVGDNSRFAGKTIVDNYLVEGASYYAELTFSKGLALLRHSVLMPNTYLNSDVYENTATAVPYSMALDTLKFGIWLTNHNYMKYVPVEGKATLTGYGTAPVMVISNAGSMTGFSHQTSTGGTGLPRMVAGFEHLKLSLIDHTSPFIMGKVQTSGINEPADIPAPVILNDPCSLVLSFRWEYRNYEWMIYDMNGKLFASGSVDFKSGQADIASLPAGTYILRLHCPDRNVSSAIKFMVNKR